MIIFLLETAGAGAAAEANFVMGPIMDSILIGRLQLSAWFLKSSESYPTILETNGILTESPLLDVQTRP